MSRKKSRQRAAEQRRAVEIGEGAPPVPGAEENQSAAADLELTSPEQAPTDAELSRLFGDRFAQEAAEVRDAPVDVVAELLAAAERLPEKQKAESPLGPSPAPSDRAEPLGRDGSGSDAITVCSDCEQPSDGGEFKPPACYECGAPLELRESWGILGGGITNYEPAGDPPSCHACGAPLGLPVPTDPACGECQRLTELADGNPSDSEGIPVASAHEIAKLVNLATGHLCDVCGEGLIGLYVSSKDAAGWEHWERAERCMNSGCTVGAANLDAAGWQREMPSVEAWRAYAGAALDPTTGDETAPPTDTCSPVQGGQTVSTRQHFSGLDPEEGEKIEMEQLASAAVIGSSSVAKVGLEPPSAPVRRGRGRPAGSGAKPKLQNPECPARVNGSGSQGVSSGSLANRVGPPAMELAMGSATALSHLASALTALEVADIGEESLSLELMLWERRALHLMRAALTAVEVVRDFSMRAPVFAGRNEVTILVGGVGLTGETEAQCGAWLCVAVEGAPNACPPRWRGWFDARTGKHLSDGVEPEAFSDRMMLNLSTLPDELRPPGSRRASANAMARPPARREEQGDESSDDGSDEL